MANTRAHRRSADDVSRRRSAHRTESRPRTGGRRSSSRATRPERINRTRQTPGIPLNALIAVGVMVAVVAMLAGPLRRWYVAWRTNEQLTATYAQLADENSDLQGDIDYLCSREGIEAEARELGYVEDGETRVVVTNSEGSDDSDTTFTTAKPEVDITDGEPWYLAFLDWLFGYEGVS